jgi:hypothetical protein
MWGGIGMILAGPITVCLAVLGRHVHQFRFFTILLGDEPVLEPYVSLYQRLLARDQDEASKLALAQAKSKEPQEIYDALFLPCLNLVKHDRENGFITEETAMGILDNLREIIVDVETSRSETSDEEKTADSAASNGKRAPRLRLLAYPGQDAENRLALQMLFKMLDPKVWDMEILSPDTLASELIELAAEEEQPMVCISALPPGGLAHARYVCKRLRARFPDIKIAVGRWAPKRDVETELEPLKDIGVDFLATSLHQTREQLLAWQPVLVEEKKQAVAG